MEGRDVRAGRIGEGDRLEADVAAGRGGEGERVARRRDVGLHRQQSAMRSVAPAAWQISPHTSLPPSTWSSARCLQRVFLPLVLRLPYVLHASCPSTKKSLVSFSTVGEDAELVPSKLRSARAGHRSAP